MFFRNVRIFRFTRPIEITAEQLEEKLQADAFKPCGPQEQNRRGWCTHQSEAHRPPFTKAALK